MECNTVNNSAYTWTGIEDAAERAERVWLARYHDAPGDQWKPLRKCDCATLNQASDNLIYIEEGRATADLMNNSIFYNFFRGPQKQLTSATWFMRKELNSKEYMLVPVLSASDAKKIELQYQKAVKAIVVDNIDTILDETVDLKDDSKVKVVRNTANNTLSIKKVSGGWFPKTVDLQRGYDDYVIDGDENEKLLGPVKHCVFVVHGIGEALFSREDVKIRSIIEEMDVTRQILQQRQIEHWRKACEQAEHNNEWPPPAPHRIELLPIEWFNKLHDSTTSLMKSLQATTLPTIPALRSIANDVIFDVLMYLTPNFCEAVLGTVTDQVQDLHRAFQRVHPNFLLDGGKYSFIGHSLGSVIVWDLLSILKDDQANASSDDAACGVSVGRNTGYQQYTKNGDANKASNGAYGPTLTKKLKPIPFEPECTIMLGSPLGMFLTLRGAHPVFDELRLANNNSSSKKKKKGKKSAIAGSKVSPFSLPTGSFFNIFHPNDPVAYRIEPLLLAQDAKEKTLPAPTYVTSPGRDLRLHIRAKQLSTELSRKITQPQNWWNDLVDSTAKVLKIEAARSSNDDNDGEEHIDELTDLVMAPSGPVRFALGGKSGRVDYSFQPGVIDSEYLSSVMAHATSSYFKNEDFQEFFLDLMKAEASDAKTCNQFWEKY